MPSTIAPPSPRKAGARDSSTCIIINQDFFGLAFCVTVTSKRGWPNDRWEKKRCTYMRAYTYVRMCFPAEPLSWHWHAGKDQLKGRRFATSRVVSNPADTARENHIDAYIDEPEVGGSVGNLATRRAQSCSCNCSVHAASFMSARAAGNSDVE
jgi:hypothetical protein